MTVLTLVAGFPQSLSGPLGVRACTCGPPPGMVDIGRDPSAVVLVATVGQQDANGLPLLVDEWYHGQRPTPILWLAVEEEPGPTAGCGQPNLSAGEQWLLVAFGPPQGPFNLRACSPAAWLDVGDDALVTEARRAFGEPWRPPPPLPTDPPGEAGLPRTPAGPTWPYVAALLGGAALLFVVVTLVARRRRQGGTP